MKSPGFLVLLFVTSMLVIAALSLIANAEKSSFPITDIRKMLPALRCETASIRSWFGDIEFGPALVLGKDVCKYFIRDDLDPNGYLVELSKNDRDSDAFIERFGDVAFDICGKLLQSLDSSQLKGRKVGCAFGTPAVYETVFLSYYENKLEALPNSYMTGSACTELPTNTIEIASNAPLFEPILSKLPEGSGWQEIDSLLKQNGFQLTPWNSRDLIRLVYNILQTEDGLRGPFIQAYEIYAGPKRLPERKADIQTGIFSSFETGPLTGLCLTTIFGP